MERVSQYQNELEFSSVVSRKKNQVVKFYATKTRVMIKVKYFHISTWTKSKIDFHIYSLANANYILNTPSQSKLKLNIKVDVSPIRIYVQDKFIEFPNLQKVLCNIDLKIKDCKQQLVDKFIKKSPYYLLDVFLKTIGMNSIILNESNIYLEPNELIPNLISFTGVDLIVFEQDIKKQQFVEIFNFIDSNIFERKPGERLNHKQKIKNFAALLLTLIVNSPLRLLKNIVIPQNVTIQFAKSIVKQSPKLYQKYLSIKGIKKIIKQRSKLINPNLNLQSFFQRILVNQQDMSWSQIKDFLSCANLHFGNKQRFYIYDFVKYLWRKLQVNDRLYFSDKRIVKCRADNQDLGMNSELFFILMLGEKVSSLKDGSIFSQLSQSKFDMQSYRILNEYTKLVNYTIESSKFCNMAQSSENHFQFKDEAHIGIKISKSYMQVQKDSSNQDKFGNGSNQNYHISSIMAQSQARQSEQIQPMLQDLIHQGSPQGRHIFFQSKELALCTQRKLNELYKKYLGKLTNSFEVSGKNVKIEHQRLKSLKAYEYALR